MVVIMIIMVRILFEQDKKKFFSTGSCFPELYFQKCQGTKNL